MNKIKTKAVKVQWAIDSKVPGSCSITAQLPLGGPWASVWLTLNSDPNSENNKSDMLHIFLFKTANWHCYRFIIWWISACIFSRTRLKDFVSCWYDMMCVFPCNILALAEHIIKTKHNSDLSHCQPTIQLLSVSKCWVHQNKLSTVQMDECDEMNHII